MRKSNANGGNSARESRVRLAPQSQILVDHIDGPALLAELAELQRTVAALVAKVAPPHEVEFITINETAEFLQVSRVTVHAWINKGILTAYKIGNLTRLKKHEVTEAMTGTQARKGGSHE